MNRFTRSLGVATLATILLGGPVQADDTPLELVEPGDAGKSCAALASEINTLSERETKAAKRAESNRKFLGFASSALQAAAPLLNSGKLGGGQGSYMAQQALGSIQQQAMQQQMQQQMAQAYGGFPGMTSAPAPAEKPASIAAQRVDHLRGIFTEKGC